MSEFSACAACDRTIRWAITNNDAFLPLDPHPIDGGNVELLDEVIPTTKGALHRARVHGRGSQLELVLEAVDTDRYVSHFATCSDPYRFRRRTKNTAAL